MVPEPELAEDSEGSESDVGEAFSSAWERAWSWVRVDCSAGFAGGRIRDALATSSRSRCSLGADEDSRGCEAGAERACRPIGPGNDLTEGSVCDLYVAVNLQDQAAKVVFALKLALSLMQFGATVADTEDTVQQVCEAVGLRPVQLEIGMKTVQASFAGGPVHLLNAPRGIVADKLVATTELANCVASGLGDVGTASRMLDDIVDAPPPYGPIVQMLAFQGLCTMAAIAAFMGTYRDAGAVAVITPFVIMAQELCKCCRPSLEPFLVPCVVGLVTPLVWKYIVPVPRCNVPVMYLSPLLVYLPGSQLTYGAYEIRFGSLVNGASQLASCVVRCMFMALALTMGWQVFGHNMNTNLGGTAGAASSMVPADMSCMFPLPWQLVFGAWNVPMLILAFIGLSIPPRKMLIPGLIGYLSLFFYISLNMVEGLKGQVPARLVDCLGLFVAGNMACLYEYLTGTPSILSIIPVLLMLAPGSHVVLSVLETLQADEHVSGVNAEPLLDLVLQGVAYALGLDLAQEIWRPLNRRKAAARTRRVYDIY